MCEQRQHFQMYWLHKNCKECGASVSLDTNFWYFQFFWGSETFIWSPASQVSSWSGCERGAAWDDRNITIVLLHFAHYLSLFIHIYLRGEVQQIIFSFCDYSSPDICGQDANSPMAHSSPGIVQPLINCHCFVETVSRLNPKVRCGFVILRTGQHGDQSLTSLP